MIAGEELLQSLELPAIVVVPTASGQSRSGPDCQRWSMRRSPGSGAERVGRQTQPLPVGCSPSIQVSSIKVAGLLERCGDARRRRWLGRASRGQFEREVAPAVDHRPPFVARRGLPSSGRAASPFHGDDDGGAADTALLRLAGQDPSAQVRASGSQTGLVAATTPNAVRVGTSTEQCPSALVWLFYRP